MAKRSNKITRTFTVTFTIHPEKARERGPDGTINFDSYPNWDVNYVGEEDVFITSTVRELLGMNKYSGMSVKVRDITHRLSYPILSEALQIVSDALDDSMSYEASVLDAVMNFIEKGQAKKLYELVQRAQEMEENQ